MFTITTQAMIMRVYTFGKFIQLCYENGYILVYTLVYIYLMVLHIM